MEQERMLAALAQYHHIASRGESLDLRQGSRRVHELRLRLHAAHGADRGAATWRVHVPRREHAGHVRRALDELFAVAEHPPRGSQRETAPACPGRGCGRERCSA
ncbi:MAG TPA: hypothetical protein VI542_04065 [Candidatus Tectomicrobia bacterium]